MDRRFFGPIFLTGFCLLQAQILLFREFMVLSSGNELALGGMLFIWLGGTGLGSLAGGRIFSAGHRTKFSYWLPLVMAFLLLGSLSVLRFGPFLLGVSWGEMLSLSSWAGMAVGALFPLCFVSGILFPLFGQMAKSPTSDWKSISGVYLVEALGAAAGGICGLFLITWINGFQLALLISSGLAACSFGSGRSFHQKALKISGGSYLFCCPRSLFPWPWGWDRF
jgi:spermidine synthase